MGQQQTQTQSNSLLPLKSVSPTRRSSHRIFTNSHSTQPNPKQICIVPKCTCKMPHKVVPNLKVCSVCDQPPIKSFPIAPNFPKYLPSDYRPQQPSPTQFSHYTATSPSYEQQGKIKYYNAWSLPSARMRIDQTAYDPKYQKSKSPAKRIRNISPMQIAQHIYKFDRSQTHFSEQPLTLSTINQGFKLQGHYDQRQRYQNLNLN